MQRLILLQRERYLMQGLRCIPARKSSGSASSLLRDGGTILRVLIRLHLSNPASASAPKQSVKLSVPIDW